MSNVLLDNSYLTSAYRCVKGKAESESDLQNFYRFLGEILSHKEIFVNVKLDGPVYNSTAEIINFLKSESNGCFEIKLLLQSEIDYDSILNILTNSILENNLDTLISSKYSEDIMPQFNGDNPDLNFHYWLMGNNPAIPKDVSLKHGATYLPFILADKIDFFKKFKSSKKKNWTIEKSLAVTSKIRSLVYSEIGKKYKLIYIPSSTRAKNTQCFFNNPSLRNLLFQDELNYNDFKVNFTNNTNILTSIISRNKCVPIETLHDVFNIRKRTECVRKEIHRKPLLKKGDSLLMYQYEKIDTLRNVLDDYLDKGKTKFSLEGFNPNFSYNYMQQEFGVSFPIMDILLKALSTKKQKSTLKKLEPFIVPILQTRFQNKNEFISNLRKYAGLNG